MQRSLVSKIQVVPQEDQVRSGDLGADVSPIAFVTRRKAGTRHNKVQLFISELKAPLALMNDSALLAGYPFSFPDGGIRGFDTIECL